MDWKLENHSLVKEFTFLNFDQALNFMLRASEPINKLNHHPEWTNIYNRVIVRLTTHDAGNQVTELDHRLARILDGVFEEMK